MLRNRNFAVFFVAAVVSNSGTWMQQVAVFALIYLLDALAWGLWRVIDGSGTNYWIGFLIVGVLLIILGAIGGLLAMRMIKSGSPPTPQMAIEEAQLIKGTLTSPSPGHPVGPVGSRQAPNPAPAERR